MLKHIIVILIALCTLACQECKVINSHLLLNTNISNNNKPIDEVFEEICIIPLQESRDSYIKNISRIKYHNDTLYIFDSGLGAVLRFREDGKYLDKISRRGRSREEYISITDFEIDSRLNTIMVLNPIGKVQEYNMQGDYIRSIKLPSPPVNYQRFALYDSLNMFIWSMTCFDAHSVNMLNIDTEEFSNGYLYNSYVHGMATVNNSFYKYSDNIYYYESLSGKVYNLTQQSYEVSYEWNLGVDIIDQSVLETEVTTPKQSQAISDGYYRDGTIPYAFVSQFQSDDYYCATIRSGVNMQCSIILYNKHNNNYTVLADPDRIGVVNLLPQYMTNDYILCSLNSKDMEAFMEYALENNFKIAGDHSDISGKSFSQVLVKLCF